MNENNPNTILPSSQNANQVMWNTNQTSKVMENKTIVYQSEVMGSLMKMVERVAPSNANILVLGESGTGKELIARQIHDRSNRKNKPFVAINCGALRETLLESELFGHEKGSFTGAYNRKIGLAEAASGGSLLHYEIRAIDTPKQAKNNSFIQEGEFHRVGGKEPIKVDIRLICATNRELDQEVTRGNFREDLFYRINTIVVSAPPLRRRKDDIPVLVNHFLNNSQHAYLNRGRSVSEDAMKLLTRYDWPGNIRELQNVCERLQILSEGHMIMVNDIPDNIRNPDTQVDVIEYDPSMTLHDLEKRYILKALGHFGGNKTQAANNLGITIKTIYNKLHEYGEFEKFAVHSKPMK
jgi:DNA-binding NtrC family response regulator